jgi:hypothetical protein
MKTLSALILSSMALIASAHATERCVPYTGEVNYECITSTLEAYDSDIYYNLSKEEIDSMLYSCKTTFHDKVVSVAQACASEAFGR